MTLNVYYCNDFPYNLTPFKMCLNCSAALINKLNAEAAYWNYPRSFSIGGIELLEVALVRSGIVIRQILSQFQDGKKSSPGTNRFPIAFCHRFHDLVLVIQVMNDPGGQQLAKIHCPKHRMLGFS